VFPLRELAYLPKGEIEPHGVPATSPRAGKLPAEILAEAPSVAGQSSSREQTP